MERSTHLALSLRLQGGVATIVHLVRRHYEIMNVLIDPVEPEWGGGSRLSGFSSSILYFILFPSRHYVMRVSCLSHVICFLLSVFFFLMEQDDGHPLRRRRPQVPPPRQ